MTLRIVTALLLLAPAAWAQTPEVSITGLRSAWYGIPSGGEVSVFSDPWRLVVGGGADIPHFGRFTDSGDPRPESDPYVSPLVVGGETALFYVWRTEPVEVWLGPKVVAYRVWEGTAPAFPDWQGNTYAALIGGFKRDRREVNGHGLMSGYRVELQAEWSPAAASIKGTDYYRARLLSSWYLSLWDLPGENQLFSGLLAFRANVQYTDGAQVPLVKLDPTDVRGYDSTFDARLVSVGSSELRLRLPSWSGVREVVPVGFGFFEAGSYSGFADASGGSDNSGWLASVGGGFGLELFGRLTPTFTIAYPLTGTERSLWWDISFRMAF